MFSSSMSLFQMSDYVGSGFRETVDFATLQDALFTGMKSIKANVKDVKFSLNGTHIFLGGRILNPLLYDVQNMYGGVVDVVHEVDDEVQALALSSDSEIGVTCHKNGRMFFWNLAQRQKWHECQLISDSDINGVSFFKSSSKALVWDTSGCITSVTFLVADGEACCTIHSPIVNVNSNNSNIQILSFASLSPDMVGFTTTLGFTLLRVGSPDLVLYNRIYTEDEKELSDGRSCAIGESGLGHVMVVGMLDAFEIVYLNNGKCEDRALVRVGAPVLRIFVVSPRHCLIVVNRRDEGTEGLLYEFIDADQKWVMEPGSMPTERVRGPPVASKESIMFFGDSLVMFHDAELTQHRFKLW